MMKPATIDGYADQYTVDCERVLVTLLRGLGPWKEDALSFLHNRFAPDHQVEGYRKDGPVAVARFELGEDREADQHEARILRQRQVSDVIEQLLARIGLETAGRGRLVSLVSGLVRRGNMTAALCPRQTRPTHRHSLLSQLPRLPQLDIKRSPRHLFLSSHLNLSQSPRRTAPTSPTSA